MRRAFRCASLVGLVATSWPNGAAADSRVVAERTVARFWAAETGGSTLPHFVYERTLAFESRLTAMAEGGSGTGEGYDDRHVRDALERHVAEDLLQSLATKLIEESPVRRKDEELYAAAHTDSEVEKAEADELGGYDRIVAAAALEQLDSSSVDALLARRALVAWYVDRTMTPIFDTSEERLREVYRSAAHPFRGRPFEQVREALGRWIISERLRAAESAFYQSARSHIRVIVTR